MMAENINKALFEKIEDEFAEKIETNSNDVQESVKNLIALARDSASKGDGLGMVLRVSDGKVENYAQTLETNESEISTAVLNQMLTINRLVDMEWKFGVTASSSESDSVGSTFLQLKLVVDKGSGNLQNIYMDESELRYKKDGQLRSFYGVEVSKFEDEYSLEVEMSRRRLAMNRVCRRLKSTRHLKSFSVEDLHHVIVDDKNEILFCYVPKVASTNWKRIFLVLMDKNNSLNPMDISANATHKSQHFHYLSEYSVSEVRHRLQNYVKFLFVRHPFERLLSAYRNKFENVNNNYFHSRFGRIIVERHRPNATNESLEMGDDVTFNEFVRYLVDPETRNDGPFNEHWQSINDLCAPCHVHYDLIGKYEGLGSEAPRVLDTVGIGHLVKFPQINRTVDTLLLLKDYFKNVTMDDVFRLYQMYAVDFKMFGYRYGSYESYSPPDSTSTE